MAEVHLELQSGIVLAVAVKVVVLEPNFISDAFRKLLHVLEGSGAYIVGNLFGRINNAGLRVLRRFARLVEHFGVKGLFQIQHFAQRLAIRKWNLRLEDFRLAELAEVTAELLNDTE